MVSNVLLSGSTAGTLLSIQRTQDLVDRTSLRLSTGKKVNSALDNPQNFFASESLKNTSADLTKLLDGIGQSIRTIEEASTGINALTGLIEQADAIAQEALRLNRQRPTDAVAIGDIDLRSVGALSNLPGVGAGDQIILSIRESDDTSITLSGASVISTITLAANDTVDDIVAKINSASINNTDQKVEASVNDIGQLVITGHDVKLNIRFQDAINTFNNNFSLATQLGFSELVKPLLEPFSFTTQVHFSITPERTLTSFSLQNALTNETALRSDRLNNLEASDGTALSNLINDANDIYEIGVNGGTRIQIALAPNQTIQHLIDAINNDATLGDKLEADFIDETGQITITATDDSVETIETALNSDSLPGTFYLGFDVNGKQSLGGFSPIDEDSIRLGTVSGPSREALDQLSTDYNKVLDQIDNIVEDANYRGINLLNNDDLETYFNEKRTNSLLTEGADFTHKGLGLARAGFDTTATTLLRIDEVREALAQVREFGQSIANDLSIVQTRQNFIEKKINTHEAGSSDLTDADLNEEGANILATQTRQSLATSVLAIGAQSQQRILTIFG